MSKRSVAAALFFCAGLFSAPAQDNEQVHFSLEKDRVRVELGGEHFTDYIFKGYSRPILFPLLAPGEVHITRSWPMAERPDEAQDHPHHKSFWWAHGDMNGVDFWSESDNAGTTVHEGFYEMRAGDTGILRSRNRYVSKDGKIIARDERVLRFYPDENGRRKFDFEITIHPVGGDLTFGDTKEGTMALRLAPTMRLEGKVAQGHIANSEGLRDGKTWGKRASWVDYYGPVNGEIVGVAIFDHPSNPRHPTWWHVRDYGLFAANPFGTHDFERKDPGTGDLVVPLGETITFKYRFYIHPGDEKKGNVAEAYENYAKDQN